MNLSKCKRWRALLHRVIVKQQEENNYPLCLQALEKCEKLKNINTQNDYKTMSKDWTDKTKQTSSLCFVNVFKFQENKFKIV